MTLDVGQMTLFKKKLHTNRKWDKYFTLQVSDSHLRRILATKHRRKNYTMM